MWHLYHQNATMFDARHRNGVQGDVLQLHDDILEWQQQNDCLRLPTLEEHRSLALRIQRYLEKDKQACVSALREAFPSDVEAVRALQLDCLEASDDMESGVKWRSDMERTMFQSIPGWREGYVPQPSFVPLTDMLFGDDALSASCEELREVFLLLEDVTMTWEMKLGRVAAMLKCSPTPGAIGEVLSSRVLHRGDDNVEEVLPRFVCRLCGFGTDEQREFHEHLVEKHRGAGDETRTMIEYRKKRIGLIEHMGPDVSWLHGRYDVCSVGFCVESKTRVHEYERVC